jgi:hypothetical protein
MSDENAEEESLRSPALAQQREERDFVQARTPLEQKSEELLQQTELFRVTLSALAMQS